MDKHTAGIIEALANRLAHTEIKLRTLEGLLTDTVATESEIRRFESVHRRDFEKIKKEILASFDVNVKNTD